VANKKSNKNYFVFVLILIFVGLISFFGGYRHSQNPKSLLSGASEQSNTNTSSRNINNFIVGLQSASRTFKLSIECVDSENLPDLGFIDQIKKDLNTKNREFSSICINNEFNQAVLASQDTSSSEIIYELADFSEPFNVTYDRIFENVKESPTGELLKADWFAKDNLYFSLYETSSGRISYIMTYEYSDKSPKGVEFCQSGIAAGTAQRSLIVCKTFVESKSSGFLNSIDLP